MSDVVYAIEKLHQFRRDADHLLAEHYQELTSFPEMPLDPNWDLYNQLETEDRLFIYTARIDGEIVGYAWFMCLKAHPHYKSLSWAGNDIIRINPDHRGKGVAKGLFDFFEADLKRRGYKVIAVRSKTSFPQLGKMLDERGYKRDSIDHHLRNFPCQPDSPP